MFRRSPKSTTASRISTFLRGVLNPAHGTAGGYAPILPGQAGPYSGKLARQPAASGSQQLCPARRFCVEAILQNCRARRIRYQLQHWRLSRHRAATGVSAAVLHHRDQHRIVARPSSDADSAKRISRLSPDITNDYAVNPNYRLGYVQIRNLDIQQQIRPTLLLNIDYTGTKGTDLDVLEAPNRTLFHRHPDRLASKPSPTKIRSPTPRPTRAPYGCASAWRRDSPSAASIHFPKSLDDASSIGAGATSGSGSRGLGAGGTGCRWRRSASSSANSPAPAHPTSRRILSISRPSAGSPASTRRTNSPRTICGNFRSATTSAGSPGTLLCARFLATGNGAATGPSPPAFHLRRDCRQYLRDLNARHQRHASADRGSRPIGQPFESHDRRVVQHRGIRGATDRPIWRCAPQQHHRSAAPKFSTWPSPKSFR